MNFLYKNKFDTNSQEDNHTFLALVTWLLCEFSKNPDEFSKRDKNNQEPWKGKIEAQGWLPHGKV